ncbi:Uncharacterised protein [Kocuria rhizophila]|nr:Uncharacterised protein [Kocuria rhizophila]
MAPRRAASWARADRAASLTGTDPASNIAAAAHEQGVGRIVCLSIAGAEDPRVNSGYGYYKGKAVQQSIYQQSPVPSVTVRSTQ